MSIIKIIVFETSIKPYLSEMEGSLEGFRNAIRGKNVDLAEVSIRLAFSAIELKDIESLIQIVSCENGIDLRMKQNIHTENVMGTFIVVKSVDNEFVSLDKQDIKLIYKHFKIGH